MISARTRVSRCASSPTRRAFPTHISARSSAGLRKPSAEVLQQLASALRVSTPLMYLRAGLLDTKDGQGVIAAIASDADLTESRRSRR